MKNKKAVSPPLVLVFSGGFFFACLNSS